MAGLSENSTFLAVAEDSAAIAIGIPTPTDANFPASQLSVTVTALPLNGAVLLADGTTPVSIGESLTVAQLIGLEFRPVPNSAGQSSDLAFTVSDPGGNTVSASATLAIDLSNTPPVATAPTASTNTASTGSPGSTPALAAADGS